MSADDLDVDQVDVVESSDEAKKALRSVYYDAMITDVVLPKRRGEPASHRVGVGLVGQVHRARGIKKPERIVAITAHEEDIDAFRADFEEYCTAVIRANGPSDEWRRRILDSIRYVTGSKLARVLDGGGTAVFTVHGIRTYGEWQSRLRDIVFSETDDVQFYTYKYGYFSSVAFLFPPARKLEVDRLEARLAELLLTSPERIVVFAHSFGTYLAVEALKRVLPGLSANLNVTIVLCGSVLPEDFNWSFIRSNPQIRVINDCGSSDYVLSVAKMTALNFGMAGKVGFSGFNDAQLFNRWFKGGHSHYFDGDEFMKKRWAPIISGELGRGVDERGQPAARDVILDGIAYAVSRVKWLVYGAVSGLLVLAAST